MVTPSNKYINYFKSRLLAIVYKSIRFPDKLWPLIEQKNDYAQLPSNST